MISFKKLLQNLVRTFHVLTSNKILPSNICIYFHETDLREIKAIENIILFFQFKGYEFKTISEFNNDLSRNIKQVALTFDDGFSNWINLLPLFNKYSIKSTFYLNSIFLTNDNLDEFLENINFFKSSELISKDEIIKIIDSNHEIGAHSHTHNTLSLLNEEQFKNDIEINLLHLSEYNNNITSFAIPFGMRRYITKNQLNFLKNKFNVVCFGEPGMLFNQKNGSIQRTPWIIEKDFFYNLQNITSNTSFFNRLTKRSGLG